MTNNKKYSLYTFFTFFAKSIIEIFIPIILYKNNVPLNNIYIYLIFLYANSVLIILLFQNLYKIFKYKGLIIISNVFFIVMLYYLFYIFNKSIVSLYILALFQSLYISHYWILRHLYFIKIYIKDNTSKCVGNILIVSESAVMFSSYLGALLLSKNLYSIIIILSGIILFVGNIFLIAIKINEPYKKIDFRIIKKIPRNDYYIFGLEQFKTIAMQLFPLYLIIYLKVNYSFIGLFNIIISIASIISVFFFSRLISKKKQSYIIPTVIIFSILWILKINIKTKFIILIIAFIEGIISKIYQTTSSRLFYDVGEKFNIANYIIITELFLNIIKLIIIILFVIFIKDLKILLYICIGGLFLTGFIKYNDLND